MVKPPCQSVSCSVVSLLPFTTDSNINEIWQCREITERWRAKPCFSALGKTFALVIVASAAASAGKDHFSLLCLFAQGFIPLQRHYKGLKESAEITLQGQHLPKGW